MSDPVCLPLYPQVFHRSNFALYFSTSPVKAIKQLRVKSLNILVLTETFFPHGGGAEYSTYRFAQLLSEKGLNVTVITNKFPKEPSFSQNGKLAIYRLPLLKESSNVKYRMLFNFKFAFSSFFQKMFTWADIVYIPRYWFSAIPVAKRFGKPVIVHLHDNILLCPISGKYDFSKQQVCHSHNCSTKCILTFEQMFGRNSKTVFASTLLNSTVGLQLPRLIALSDRIICVSNTQKNDILEKFPTLQNKIRSVYNLLPEVSPLKIHGDDYGFFGGPNPIKGSDILFKALAEITGNTPVRVHATNFEKLPKKQPTPMGNAEVFFYKKLVGAPLDELYRKIRAVIVPSVCLETFSYVMSEAILKGRIVIASNVGSLPEVAEGCRSVFFFESGNPQDLAEKIKYVNSLNKETVTDLITQSRELFLKKFNNEQSLTNFIGICTEIANNPSS
ncbi:MAG: glycosyltransferase family 4 protein [Candidatus Bathyarchaeota archaeon]|nr:glycosyltransferase family 4 protein [Candidatus Bathyarchaeota archaeon]